MSMLSKFLWGSKHGRNPADAAMPYINKGIGTQQPYVEQGQAAGNLLNTQYGNMAQNTNQYLNDILKNYKESEGFADKRDKLLQIAQNTAGAGGYAGNPMHQEGAAGIANALMNEDTQQWLKNYLGIQGAGMAGQQHAADQGFEAATNQGNLYGQQGQLAYQGQAWKNQRDADRANQLAKILGGLGGAAIGGYTGGPMGALEGAKTGSQFF